MRRESHGAGVSVLRVVLPVLGCLIAVSGLRTGVRPAWWEVRFQLTARGDYTVKDSGTTYSGEFLYRAQWDGTMERDGADFLLYYAATEPQAWEVREKASLQSATRIMTDKESAEKPGLRLNYVLRQGADILFDFDVGGVRIPLNSSPDKFDLVLPRSREHAGEEDMYNEFVSKGKNRVFVDEKDLGERPLEKSFSWEWKRQQWILKEKGVVLVAGAHKASVTITIIPHD
jgi:hypothetical protein